MDNTSFKLSLWAHTIAVVLKKPSYAFLAAIVTLMLVLFSFTLSVRSIIGFMWHVPTNSFLERIIFTISASITSVPLNLTNQAIIFIIIIAILAGINTALVVYYLRRRASVLKGSSVGFLGMVSAVLGIGCASCGSVILSSFIGLSASSAVISFLPLKGIEFNLLAVALLTYSIFLISQKLLPKNLLTCKVKITN